MSNKNVLEKKKKLTHNVDKGSSVTMQKMHMHARMHRHTLISPFVCLVSCVQALVYSLWELQLLMTVSQINASSRVLELL